MRARNIKPGFFNNEKIALLAPEIRILFIGLWLIADRDGRLEDRPLRIKILLFALDDLDIDAGLTCLHEAGLIIRYNVEGQALIQIPSWEKHQKPHPNEKSNNYPAPLNLTSDPKKGQSDPADMRNEDSMNDESLGAANAAEKIPFTEILQAYRSVDGFAPVHRMTDNRRSHIRARWNDNPDMQTPEAWSQFWAWIPTANPWLMTQPKMASLDWITKNETNFAKVREGKYA
ncbi:MAG: hypothetical protein AAF578_00410 [Pseudomonadota bacterium]